MVTDIHEDTNLLLWDAVLVRITRNRDDGSIEIVTHPSVTARVSHRRARKPYRGILHLAGGSTKRVDLSCTDDWGNIQYCDPDECKRCPALGWGNDVDGHIEIVRVTDMYGETIPLYEFERDVQDFIIHNEY